MYIKNDELWLLDGFEMLRDMDTERINNAIVLVSREIDEYCNTCFEPAEDSYTLDFCGSFYTRRQPLLEVTELLLDGTPLIHGAEFFVYPEFSQIRLQSPAYNAVCEGGSGNTLTVRYSYGYRTIPATVKQVAAELIKLDAESAAVPLQGMQSESWDNEYSYSRRTSKDFTPSELRRGILTRLDVFKVRPPVQSGGARNVRARFL